MQKKSYEYFKKWIKGKNLQNRINKLAEKYKNKKVVVYGAGVLASAIFDNYDLSGLNIVGVADKSFFYGDEKFKTYPAISPNSIKEIMPDVILIAVHSSVIIEEYLEENIFPITGNIPTEPLVKKNMFEKIQEIFQ